jgi:secretion/DNA translocation related TadE-like protein
VTVHEAVHDAGPAVAAGTRWGRATHGVRDDRGAGTVLVLALVAVVVALVLGTAVLVGAVVTRGSAQSAADLAALAAAASLQRGAADPCSGAREVAARNGAQVEACLCAPDRSCTVSTTLATKTGAAARATARAGPASLADRG